MHQLLQLVEQEGIFISYRSLTHLPGTVLGFYFTKDNQPFIALEQTLNHNYPLHRSILAEELGHHFTVPQSSVLVPYTSYSLKLALSRDEAKALRWACDFLLPEESFEETILDGIQTVYDLAAHFRVTPWLIMRRIHFLKADELRWKRLMMKMQVG